MNDNDTLEVHFMHPRNSSMTLTADISPQCTGQEALQELMRDQDGESAFLPSLRDGQSYELAVRRTEQAITLNMTFAEAGVASGDTIDVRQSATGGCCQTFHVKRQGHLLSS
jgi:hypothetical protein